MSKNRNIKMYLTADECEWIKVRRKQAHERAVKQAATEQATYERMVMRVRVFVLYMRGYTHKEICDTLSLSHGQVATDIGRVKRYLIRGVLDGAMAHVLNDEAPYLQIAKWCDKRHRLDMHYKRLEWRQARKAVKSG